MTAEKPIRAKPQEGPGFGELRAGNLGVRIAYTPAEIDAVQALRFRVFYEEMGATPDKQAAATRPLACLSAPQTGDASRGGTGCIQETGKQESGRPCRPNLVRSQ